MSVLRSKLNWKKNIWIWKQCWFSPHYKVFNDGICYTETNLYRVHANIARKPKNVRKPYRCWSLIPTIYVDRSSLRLFGLTMDLKGMDETNHEHKRLQKSTNSKSNMLLVKRPILVSGRVRVTLRVPGKHQKPNIFSWGISHGVICCHPKYEALEPLLLTQPT